MDQGKSISIAIYRTDGIGDAILSTACLHYLFRLDPIPKIYWISYEPISGLIERSYPELVQIRLDRSTPNLRMLKEITQQIGELDIVLDLKRSSRSLFLCSRLAKAKRAKYHTWNKQSIKRSMMVFLSFLRGRKREKRPATQYPKRYQMMLDCLGKALNSNSTNGSQPNLPVASFIPEVLSTRPSIKNWIAVMPAGKYPLKRAPLKIFQEILGTLIEGSKEPIGILLLGDQEDRKVADSLEEFFSRSQVIENLCGSTSLYQNAQLLSNCKASLSNDTALAHLSEAVQTPVAMLFGPTVEEFGYEPFLNESKAFSVNLGCRPCTKGGAGKCRYQDKLCFTKLDAAEISRFLISKLN